MRRLNIRFQPWMIGWTMSLVVILSVVFLFTVFRTFEDVAEDRAIGRFELISNQVWSQLDGMVKQSGRFVSAQADAELSQFVTAEKRLDTQAMVSAFVGSIGADPNIYSHFFALNNEEFFQVIGIRGDAKLIEALKAPAGSYFAIRRITLVSKEVRSEVWQFLDQRRQRLGVLDKEAKLVPTSRPWYASAMTSEELIVTDPYLFASNGELGITVAKVLPEKAGVLATDISLRSLQGFIASFSLPPNAAIAIKDGKGRVLAFHGKGERFAGLNIPPLTPLEQIDNPWLKVLRENSAGASAQVIRLGEGDGEKFVVSKHQAEPVGGAVFQVVVLAPLSDFLGAFKQAEKDVMLVSVALLLVLLPLAWLGSRQISKALRGMARESERMKRLDFSGTPEAHSTFLYEINTLGEAQSVMQSAIRQRTADLRKAQDKLAHLVDNGLLLSKERNRDKLLSHILTGGQELANCAAGTLYLKTEHNTLKFALRTNKDDLPSFEVPLYHAETGEPMTGYVSSYVALHNETVIIDDVYSETRFDLSGTKRFSEESGFRTVSMLTVPLSPRDGEVIGVLQLMNALDVDTGEVIPFPPELISFVEALAAQSAVTLENHSLLEAQKALMDSMIKIVAGAIDAKSPYTGGHCERVPELAVMLAQEAQKVQEGSLASFHFKNEDEWSEFRIGAWLHDCGKVTTPEYVVDKATKLETIYNRIHEIRMRFEVLLRDARIECLESIAAGTPVNEAEASYAERKQQLVDEYVFIAECNMGGEFMAPELVDRVKQISARTWVRHFDDRIGLSHEELRRYEGVPVAEVPARENLLSDQPWHIVKRTDTRALDPKYGFKVKVPEHLYNFGEVYNLSIARGTLTEEERFKINEHIIQTIVMLDSMPFPKHLKRVPEYAGTHHETLIGSGYPRKLANQELTVPSRIMAIADIFEALTASDRPYKKAKTLSESVKILSFFKKDKHIDAELFDLFLTSGVYKRYGERYLKPEQIDEVDITKFVG